MKWLWLISKAKRNSLNTFTQTSALQIFRSDPSDCWRRKNLRSPDEYRLDRTLVLENGQCSHRRLGKRRISAPHIQMSIFRWNMCKKKWPLFGRLLQIVHLVFCTTCTFHNFQKYDYSMFRHLFYFLRIVLLHSPKIVCYVGKYDVLSLPQEA